MQRRVLSDAAALGLLAALGSLASGNPPLAAGLFMGTSVSMVNFSLLSWNVDHILRSGFLSPGLWWTWYILRYLLGAGALAAAALAQPISFWGTFAGLLSVRVAASIYLIRGDRH
ncbi:MAG: ATP synthase subunit I [Bacillota bacterium]